MIQDLMDDCSNCTFMELKLVLLHACRSAGRGSNCTFMELKYDLEAIECVKYGVLIVPLWN